MQLTKRIVLRGSIELLTGLHIGAGKDAIEIGGIDAPVVKHPHPDFKALPLPYIPGSSLKGKLRCLLEWALNCVREDGQVWDGEPSSNGYGIDPILRIFGTTTKDWKGGPTRLLVRDAFLNPVWVRDILERGLHPTEEKFENNIDRIQGKAGVGIRKIERVPAGALFDFEMIYRVFDLDDGGRVDEDNLQRLFEAMRLLEQDALGGSGSRGYGRIKFRGLTQDGVDLQTKFDAIMTLGTQRTEAA